ncbi:hypothetical protein CRYUN_Cryun09bG0005300 [Craigia yunnanensis]
MPPKYETSSNPDQMMNPERSYTSSTLDIVELTSSLQVTEPRRASLHKRSASDSLAFVNKPYLVEPGSFQRSNGAEGCLKLERGDGDKKAIDHNIKESEDSSSASSLITETHRQNEPRKWCRNFDPDIDPKKIKRLLANRVSAQKSRLRKLEYIEKLKKDINTEQARVSLIAPQVAFYEFQRRILQKENNAMKQRMETLEKENAKKEAEFQALKDERDMLSLTYFLMQEGI